MNEFTTPNNGIKVEADEITLIGPDGILDNLKFMIQYRIASIDVNAPEINITFENGKTVKFTGYSDLEIYELFTQYLTPDSVLFE